MGFSPGSYEVLSSPSATSGGGTSRQTKPQQVLDFVRKWLLCGWARSSVADCSASASACAAGVSGCHGYVKPSGWNRLLRRAKAKSRKVQSKCSQGLCFSAPSEPLNYQTMDSYKKNFDEGRESWWGQPPQPATLPLSSIPGEWKRNPAAPILWEDRPLSPAATSIWERRSMASELRVSAAVLVAA